MAAGGGSGGAARRPIAAGGSICYSHGRDLAPAGPAQPPQPRDQPQVRPRCSPSAAAALTWSGGPPAGFLTASSAGSRVRLAEQWKEEKRKASDQPQEEKKKKAPSPELSPKAVVAEKEKIAPFLFLLTFSSPKPSSGQAGAPSLSDHFRDLLFRRPTRWPRAPGELVGGGDGNGGEARESGHQGARGWPGIGA